MICRCCCCACFSAASCALAASTKEAEKLRNGEITKIEYEQWRYRYPELDATGHRIKIPSEELSDALINELRKD